MFCVSKGLGAPAGSLLVGRKDDMAAARLYRKRLGGGMRQSGILASAGLLAVNEMTERLAEDHANAKLLANGLCALPGIEIDPVKVQTNIVIFDIAKTGIAPADFVASMKARGVLLSGVGGTRVRMVTHYDVSRQDCEKALEAARLVL